MMLRKIFKIYLGHSSIIAMYTLAILAWAVMLTSGQIGQWWWLIGVLVVVPFYEWVVHRYILHADMRGMPKRFQDFWEKVHPGHHKNPSFIPWIFAPFIVAFQVPLSFFILAYLIFQNFYAALMLYCITQSYYLFYEWMHLAHHLDFYNPKTQWGKELKRNHMLHHFKNERYWWGITNTIGDKILGSKPEAQDVPFSVSVKDIGQYHLPKDMGH